MKNQVPITEIIETMENALQQEMQNIMDIWSKAKNYQKLAQEQYEKMATMYEPLEELDPIVKKMYTSIDEIKMLDIIETELCRKRHLKQKGEE